MAESKWDYKTWYQQNKESLASSRKERYDSDPVYRAEIVKRNKEYRDKLRALNPPGPPPEHKPRLTQLIEITVNDKTATYPAFHIGNLAKRLNRSVPTIYGWERNGVLPKTPFRSGSEDKMERLYTSDMIEVVVFALENRNGRISIKDHSFFDEVRSQWAALGAIAPEREVNGKT